MAINVTDALVAKTAKGKLGSASLIFLDGDEKNLQQRSDEIDETINTVISESILEVNTKIENLQQTTTNNLAEEKTARKLVDGVDSDTYIANSDTTYITEATSLNNADVLLDAAIKNERDRAVAAEKLNSDAIKTANDNILNVKEELDNSVSSSLDELKQEVADLLDSKMNNVALLNTAPTEDTLSYTYNDKVITFVIGNIVRVPDSASETGYSFYQLHDITSEGKAVWSDLGSTGNILETVAINIGSNQSSSDTSLIGVRVLIEDITNSETILDTTWEGSTIYTKVYATTLYRISVSSVLGYETPNAIEHTALFNTFRLYDFTYNTCILTVNLTGVTESILTTALVYYGGSSYAINNGDSIKVPYNSYITVLASNVANYGTPKPVSFTADSTTKSITLEYVPSSVKIQILSNQSADDIINTAIATVKYGSTSIQAYNNQSVSIPTDLEVTVTFLDIEGYRTPSQIVINNTEGGQTIASGTYSTCIVTVNITGPSNADSILATLSYGSKTINITNSETAKVPYDSEVTVTVPQVSGYATPNSITFTANTVLKTIPMSYTESTLLILIASNLEDDATVNNATATVSYGSTSVLASPNLIVSIPTDLEVTVTFSNIEGYLTPDNVIINNTNGGQASATGVYKTCITTVYMLGLENEITATATVSYSGNSYTLNSGESIKVPYNSEITISGSAVNYHTVPSSVVFTANSLTYSTTLLYIASKLLVYVLSNQSNDTTISSTAATVSYGSNSILATNNSILYIPTNLTVTVTYPTVTGYKTPSSVTINNTNGGIATSSGTYYTEIVTVNVSLSNGSSPSGTVITINGESVTVTSSGTFTKKIPYDTSYSVSASSLSGYTTPTTLSFIAGLTSRTVYVTYEYKKTGVLIVTGMNTLYTLDEYVKKYGEGGGNIAAVAIISSYHKIMIPVKESITMYDGYFWENSLYLNYITPLSATDALHDYNGKTNTSYINNICDNSNSAALQCANIWVLGQQCYLPSVGEMNYIDNNYSAIQEIVDTTDINLGLYSGWGYLTSTLSTENSHYCWYYEFGLGVGYSASTGAGHGTFLPIATYVES